MTEKELLYLEDAVGHEMNLAKICDFTMSNLEDESLISFMEEEANRHNHTLNSLIEKLGGKANE